MWNIEASVVNTGVRTQSMQGKFSRKFFRMFFIVTRELKR